MGQVVSEMQPIKWRIRITAVELHHSNYYDQNCFSTFQNFLTLFVERTGGTFRAKMYSCASLEKCIHTFKIHQVINNPLIRSSEEFSQPEKVECLAIAMVWPIFFESTIQFPVAWIQRQNVVCSCPWINIPKWKSNVRGGFAKEESYEWQY